MRHRSQHWFSEFNRSEMSTVESATRLKRQRRISFLLFVSFLNRCLSYQIVKMMMMKIILHLIRISFSLFFTERRNKTRQMDQRRTIVENLKTVNVFFMKFRLKNQFVFLKLVDRRKSRRSFIDSARRIVSGEFSRLCLMNLVLLNVLV